MFLMMNLVLLVFIIEEELSIELVVSLLGPSVRNDHP